MPMTPPFLSGGQQLFVLPQPARLEAVAGQGVGPVVAEGHWRLGRLDGVHGGAVRRVGNIHDHTQLVHAPNDLHAELAEPTVVAFEDPVADVGLAAVGQAGQPYPGVVEHVHPV